MKLPTLYSRTATGAIQLWEIEIANGSYRTYSGQIDGLKNYSKWTMCETKNAGRSNEKSAYEQAFLEAEAKWQKKKDKGYFESINDVDKHLFVEPMLAKNYDDYKDKIEFPVYSQPKLDGIRCIATAEGLFSRNGKEFISVPHIHKALQKAFNNFTGVIFDGELYADKYSNDFNKICSIAKKTKPTNEDLLFAAKNIEYHIYDRVDSRLRFGERFESIRRILGIDCPSCIKIVNTKKLNNRQSVDEWYETYVENGYEGQMIRLDKPYENKRSKYLLKRKEFQDAEFEIVEVNEGVGGRMGTAGNFKLRDSQGREFFSNIKGDFCLLADYLSRKDQLVGKTATVQFFNYTPAGVPRFPFVTRIAREDYE